MKHERELFTFLKFQGTKAVIFYDLRIHDIQHLQSTYLTNASINSVLHLLSARVPRFVPSELPGSCPGVGPIIYYHKYQVVS